ncbi:MAG TPA: serine hydrolase domain-containing protein [Gemmatimonadaceae bacterium]|jgi:CubicO group peptidase (beta-lactamase class C family)
MMRSSRLAGIGVAVVMLVGRPAPAQSPSRSARPRALSAAERIAIDSLFKAYDTPHSPGCALGVMRDGGLAYARGYGMADLERQVPITPSTAFDIGSTTKQFTAASLALLVADGKLSFDDDVRKYIPELPDYGTPITIDHLLRHTSGLRDYNGLLALAGYSLEEVTTDSQALALVVRQRRLNFKPGSRHEYSNTGYFLASVIIKRVSGKSLAEFARERLFMPLGMTHTLFRNEFAMLIPGRALGYAPDEHGGFKISMSNWEETGDGALHLTIEDALKWDENFYHPRVGGTALIDRLQTRGRLDNGDTIGYARGLFVDEYRGVRRIHHGGDWIGYHAAFNRYPIQHTSVVIFCNSDAIAPTELADRVADIVLARELRGASASVATVAQSGGTPSSSGLVLRPDRFVGSYQVAETRTIYRIASDSGRLALMIGGRSLPLRAQDSTTFAVAGFPAVVEFTFDGSPVARAMRLRVGGDKGESAARFEPIALTADELRSYEGSYSSPELGVTWPIALEDGKLVIKSEKRSLLDVAGPLQPTTKDAFEAPGGFVQFTRDPSGRISGFDLSASRMRDIRFDRR